MDGMLASSQMNPNPARFTASLPLPYRAGLPTQADGNVSCADIAKRLYQILDGKIPTAANMRSFPALGCVEITCPPHQQHAVRQSLETFLGREHVRDISDVVVL